MRDSTGFTWRRRLTRLRRTFAGRRVPLVRQMTATDCGAAALTMVLRYHGRHAALHEVRYALGTGRHNATIEGLVRTARDYGLASRGVELDGDDIDGLAPGTILYWEYRHFVVLEGSDATHVAIADPAMGRRSVPIATFRDSFTGIAILFEPTPAFETREAPPTRRLQLLGQVLESGRVIGGLIVVALLTQVLAAALPLLTGLVIDRVVPRKDYSLLFMATMAFCAMQGFSAFSGFVRARLLVRLRTDLEQRFTLRFFDHLIDLPYPFFQQWRTGDLMLRLGSNNAIRDILSSALLSTVLDGLMAAIYLLLLLFASPRLTLLVIALGAARLALLALMRWKQRPMLAESLENQALSQTHQVEILGAMETLKAMGVEREAVADWSRVFLDGLRLSIRRGHLEAAFNVLLSVLGTATNLVLTFYGAFLVLEGYWTLGTMIASAALAAGFLGPLNSLVSSALQWQMLDLYLDRINDVLDTPTEQARGVAQDRPVLRGALTLEGVSFRYAPQTPAVLTDISASIEAGTRVALVGRTGSGKSTLARVMAGLYEPEAGRMLFDGRDLETLDRRALRRQLGVVTQETQLFGGSIRRNLALWNHTVTLDQLMHAARLACIHDDIVAMPKGYDTILSDRGLSLSGGQRQRLAIARALVNAPSILILDEATSHLDADTEAAVARNLESLCCTTIVIAHRLALIRQADLILVLDGGRVVAHGRHETLLRGGGVYGLLFGSETRDRTEVGRPIPAADRVDHTAHLS